jgi:RNA polymerase sigma-70 factor (ECF subfamily)
MPAFQELYRRYYPDVYRFALFLTGDHGRAEDLAAETFVRAWIARDRIKVATVRAYLFTIAKNLYRDERRREPAMSELADPIVDPRPAVDEQVHHTLALAGLRAPLRGMASGDRRALLMFSARGMSYREIAATLGISIGAVKARIFRARGVLLAAARLQDGDSR